MVETKNVVFTAATKTEAGIFIRQVLGVSRFQWENRTRYDLFRIQEEFNVSVVITGMGPEASYEGMKAFLNDFPVVYALIGIGVCGGLSKTLSQGDLVMPSEILFQGKLSENSAEWLRLRLLQRSEGPVSKSLYTSNKLIDMPAVKAAIYAATGAEAVDMESHSWAKACREAGVACVVVRSVLDEAHQSISPELSTLVDERGNVKIGQVVKSLLSNPLLIKEMMRYNPKNLRRILSRQLKLAADWLASERKVEADQRREPNVVSKIN